ncbi:MAG: NTP transferase domain-containing protein [Christensenellaceae bacterium]|jgi:mannose-1-phosphate guanylyltransferase/phosphomannomutase|nr:NTP transferase domain-containing protein [Christensenellaceae bacterium]
MRAIIMAGGEGKRLRPLTCTDPKPMVPLLNKPVIDYCVELLAAHGIRDITATLHYLPNKIRDYLGDGGAHKARISYSLEDKPLGTAGSVRLAAGEAQGTLLVLSGDALTDVDLTAALQTHTARKAAVTIILKRVQAPTEYGVVLMNEEGAITRFLEKPQLSEVFSDLANTGIYILEPEALKLVPKDARFDFACDLFPLLLKRNMPIYGHVTDRYWCDIGDLRQYLAAQRDLLTGQCRFETKAVEREGVFMEPGALVSAGAVLMAPCYIGAGAEVAENAIVADGAVVCSGARIGRGSSIKRSVLMKNARVRENAEIRGAILCEGAHVDSGASVFAHTALGARTSIGKRSMVDGGACVWPEKRVDDDAVCSEHLIWDAQGGKSALDMAVRGFSDMDLTPERAARIGAAFALSAKAGRGGELALATEGSQQAVMLKHALLSGMLSQGADVCDLGCCAYSAFEYGIRNLRLKGGVYVRHGVQSPHESELALCDATGSRLSGSALRTLRQELESGAKHPLTCERLGILQQVGGAARAYEAHLLREMDVQPGEGITIILGANAEVYDAVARVLLPYGYGVRYIDSRDPNKLYGAMLRAEADAGCIIGEAGELEAVFYKETQVEAQRCRAAFALGALAEGRAKRFVLPVGLPEEYARQIEARGGAVERCASSRAAWRRRALEAEAYLPELFEPEAAIVRLAALCRDGRLEAYLSELPEVCVLGGEVGCSWKEMGRVLRRLVESEPGERVELIDGVKVKEDKGWILVRPNAELTACRVIAGSYSAEYAQELTDLYLDKVKRIAEEKE